MSQPDKKPLYSRALHTMRRVYHDWTSEVDTTFGGSDSQTKPLEKYIQSHPIEAKLRYAAIQTRRALLYTGFASELKHLGVPMPELMRNYGVDFILPASIAYFSQVAIHRFTPYSREVGYLMGFSICATTELMQKFGYMAGTYDVADLGAFAAGTVVGYLLDRASSPNLQSDPKIAPANQ